MKNSSDKIEVDGIPNLSGYYAPDLHVFIVHACSFISVFPLESYPRMHWERTQLMRYIASPLQIMPAKPHQTRTFHPFLPGCYCLMFPLNNVNDS